jgi:apolipoprotein N-acyltransferase
VSTSRALLFSGLSGVLLAFAFAPVAGWPLGWIGLAPWFVVLGRVSVRGSLGSGAAFGLVLGAAGMHWLTVPTWIGYIAVFLYFALFHACVAPVLRAVIRVRSRFQPLLVAAAWVGTEFLIARLFTGIPWLLLGYTQVSLHSLIQIADLTGVYGVTFLLALASAILARGFQDHRRGGGGEALRRSTPVAGVWLILVIAAWIYGEVRLRSFESSPDVRGPTVVAIQPNIPQALKDTADRMTADRVFKQNVVLTERALEEVPRPDLLVWAETMNPTSLFPLGDGEFRRFQFSMDEIAKLPRIYFATPFLLGTVYFAEPPRDSRVSPYYNSAILFGRDGKVLGRYDKLHPIPWAEYVPLGLHFVGDLIERYAGFEMNMLAGEHAFVFPFGEDGAWSFGALICFDVIYPRYSRRMVAGGARFLVNMTNEGWFGESAEFDQLLAISVFRAVENRVGMVRATNSGISAYVDYQGRVRDRVRGPKGGDRAVEGILRCRVRFGGSGSVYTHVGDAFAVVCAVAALLTVLTRFRKRSKVVN